MAHTTDTITKPVSILADIATVLGSGSGDLGTLCRSTAVNKWAKYKPVRYRTLLKTGKTEVVAGRSDYWEGDGLATDPYICAGLELAVGYQYANGLGIDGASTPSHGINRVTSGNDRYKLRFTSETGASTGFLYRLVHGQCGWQRATPTGGTGSSGYPYRALDFDGYLHSAECPFPAPPPTGTKPAPSGMATVIADIPDDLQTDNLHLDEITLPSVLSSLPLTGFYLTLVFYKSDYTDMFWKSSQYPLSTLQDTEQKRKKVAVKLSNISGAPSGYNRYGSWKMRCFLSSYPLDSDSSNGSGYTNGLTSGDGIKFVLANPVEDTITFLDTSGAVCNVVITSAKWKGAEGNAQVKATIENYLGAQMSISSISVEVVDALGHRVTEPGVTNPVSVTPPSGGLAAGDSLGISASFPSMSRQVGCSAKVTVTATASGHSVTTTPANPVLAFEN